MEWIDELNEMLTSRERYTDLAPEKSIMEYEKICNHDSGFMCSCRREYVINFIKEKCQK